MIKENPPGTHIPGGEHKADMKVLVFNCRKVLEINCRKLLDFACFLQEAVDLYESRAKRAKNANLQTLRICKE